VLESLALAALYLVFHGDLTGVPTEAASRALRPFQIPRIISAERQSITALSTPMESIISLHRGKTAY